jgi:phage/plasmid-like protein (TIGR03299 family)
MSRTATWSQVGTDVSAATNLDDVIEKAGLNYTVEKKKIQVCGGKVIPDKFATVRDDGHIYGIVGKDYNLCQNRPAFDFINFVDGINFVKAGETQTGRIYIIGELPERYVLGDNMKPYIIFQNGHNGIYTIKAAITTLRIICQNQFNFAFKNAANTVNIRHSSTLEWRMKDAQKVLQTAAVYMDQFATEAEKLACININGKEELIARTFYKIDEAKASPVLVERAEAKRESLLKAYQAEDNQNFKGTAWGMVNAFADVNTHAEPDRKSNKWEESRFEKVTFNPMNDFLKVVEAVA